MSARLNNNKTLHNPVYTIFDNFVLFFFYRIVSIKVTVEIQTTTSPLHRKDLLVRLTDDKDPFFLYNLCLGEDDFQM